MPLTSQQKHYIKKNVKKLPAYQMAFDLGLSEKEIRKYIKSHWPKEQYERLAIQKEPVAASTKTNDFNFKEFFADNINIFIGLFLLVFVAYFSSLNNSFVSDDIPAILKNPNIGNVKYVFSAFFGFAQSLVYYTAFKIGGLVPGYFRFFSILLHLGSTFVIFTILSLLTKRNIAIFSAVIFAVHPILIESITWISGMPYVLYSFFFLSSFLAYILSENNKKAYFASLVFFTLSVLSSEKAMVFFLVLAAYEISFKSLRLNWKKLVPYFFLSIAMAFIFLGKIGQRISGVEAMSYQNDPDKFYNPLVQLPVAISSYLKLIFWPQKLTLYHTEMGFTKGEYILMFLVFIVFIGAIIYAYAKNKKIFFWLSFFIITLLPTLTPFKISWIVAERYAYLGSLGIFVVVAIFFDWLIEKYRYQKEANKYAIYSLFAIIMLALSVRTIVRNIDWKNEDNLWIATAQVSPSGPNIHNNLGDVYGRQGDLERSAEEFKKAIEINPNYADAYHNLGNTYRDMKKYDLAIQNYQKALSINPSLWQSYQNMAAIFFDQGDFQNSEAMIKKALEINPNSQELQNNLNLIETNLNKK